MSQNEEFRMLKGIQSGEVVHSCARVEPGVNVLTANFDPPVRRAASEGFTRSVSPKQWRELMAGVGTR